MTRRLALPARRSPHDREILRLAVPALGALAAEPLYVLVDTAIVGNLGTRPLAGLAVAGIVLTAAFAIFNFLAYATTAAVARRIGAGDRRAAAELGVDGMWLALGLGVLVMTLGLLLAGPIVDAMGASRGARPFALTYLRISLLGAPAMLVMLAGSGYVRGRQDTRPTLWIAVGSNVVNLVLEVVLVYGFDTGIAGSAWGTVVAQVGGATAYVVLVARSVRAEGASVRPRAAGIRQTALVAGPLVVRTGSLLAVFLATTNLAARLGDDEVAAHQIAFQIFLFLALSLDALAVAAQAIIGRALGAASADEARAAARRMIEWGIGVGILFGIVILVADPWLVRVFTDDQRVRDLAFDLLLVLAALQPLNAVVFVLDGVLIGAGDQGYLAVAMVAAAVVFVPAAVIVTVTDAGVVALWGALALWFVARAVGMWLRYRTPRWQVTGAVRGS